MRFRVELSNYLGPVELLLYLVRKHELEVAELSLAAMTEQYLHFLTVIQSIDVDSVGDFLEIASTLIEMKSKSVLPAEPEVDEELEDPRRDLVRRLLAFRQYRDAASMLEERARQWRERFPRQSPAAAAPISRPSERPIQEVELWDLVSAFGRVLKKFAGDAPHETVRCDETPIHVHMQRIDERLQRERRVAFADFFDSVTDRPTLVGMFLAVLELVRHRHARAAQFELFGEIWLEPGDEPLPSELRIVGGYESRAAA
jgi:segregation and condensation protein A